MKILQHLTATALAALVLALPGCGGGGNDDASAQPRAPAPVQVDTARTARTTVDAAVGGTVTATAADGRRYTLTVPPGALAASTEITATPVLTMGDAPLATGVKGAVRFAPSGLRFALPATLRIEGADPAAAAGTTLVGFARSADGRSMQLVPTAVDGAAIEIPVQHFSDLGVSQATAQQVRQVPVDATASAADALMDEYTRGLSNVPLSALANAELLVRLHDTRVAPRLAGAQASTNAAERALAVEVARVWLTIFTLSTDTSLPLSDQPGGLGPVVTAVRQGMLDILLADFESGRSACMAPAPVGAAHLAGLQQALLVRVSVDFFGGIGIVDTTPGLDAATTARRINDCVRVVFVPQTPPPLEIGRPASLDAQAQLIFAADPNASVPVPFAFEVSSNDAAVASPTGFSDAQGRYTTVVTPGAAQPVFAMAACMVVTLRDGGPVDSVLCGRQTVGGAPGSVVLAGRVTVAQGSSSSGVRGSVDFRVRADPDGRLTVVEATGQVIQTGTSTAQCRPTPVADLIEVTLRSRTVDTITQGAIFQSTTAPTHITAFGPGVRTSDSLLDPSSSCTVTTTTRNIVDSDEFSSATVNAIELGTDGPPAAIVFNSGGYSGRLLRE